MEAQITKYVTIALVALILLAGIGMGNKQEETRPLSYTKGVYGGVPDQALDQSTVDALRHRTSRYRSSGI